MRWRGLALGMVLTGAGLMGAQAFPAKSERIYWQCVTFARSITGMNIHGDAWTWWSQAKGHYDQGLSPKIGAVLVFKPQGHMRRGHVAVVTQILTDRLIQVTHANWSPINGHRGQVEDSVNVMDVSDKGDWSAVKVWYNPQNDLGTTVYSIYGFIYPDGKSPQVPKDIDTKPIIIADATSKSATESDDEAADSAVTQTQAKPVVSTTQMAMNDDRVTYNRLSAKLTIPTSLSSDVALSSTSTDLIGQVLARAESPKSMSARSLAFKTRNSLGLSTRLKTDMVVDARSLKAYARLGENGLVFNSPMIKTMERAAILRKKAFKGAHDPVLAQDDSLSALMAELSPESFSVSRGTSQ